MIYEGTVSHLTVDKDGNEKVVKDRYAVDGVELFADAEYRLLLLGTGRDMDVIALKRSQVREVVNGRTREDEKVWLAEVEDTFTDDDGNEKPVVYKVMLYAKTFDEAYEFMNKYLKQGFNMQLVNVKKTSIIDVLL